MPKVYITKFALKQGIVIADARITPMGEAVVPGAYPWQSMKFGKLDYHTDPAKAQARAKAMAEVKANQLAKEAERLRALDFAIQEEAEV